MAYIDRAKNVSWLTPEHVLDWWYNIFRIDEFDLDPACHPQSLVRAKKKFFGEDEEHDGFLVDWREYGEFMFSNPPFGDRPPKKPDLEEVTKEFQQAAEENDTPFSAIEAELELERRLAAWNQYLKVFHPCTEWIQKFDATAQRGMKIGAVLPALTSNAWFHNYIGRRSSMFCLLQRRIKFLHPGPDGTPVVVGSPGQAHMVVLWAHGRDDLKDRFRATLEPHGLVIEPG